jgi:hypothetical protein
VATPNVNGAINLSTNPAASIVVRHFAGYVTQITCNHCDFVTSSGPQPREVVETGTAGLSRHKIVLMDDQDLHRESGIAIRSS